jgi:heme o synthase
VRKNRTNGIIAVYADLIKYKLSLAVTFSAVTGYFIFNNKCEASLLFLTIGVFSLASGSAALNQYTEREYDALMERTRNRPLPMENIEKRSALLMLLIFLSLGVISLILAGIIPFLLGVFNVFLYNLVYTRLKRVTHLAILPGALVGAVPPFIGYTAAGGINPGLEIILFSAFMFFWQLPHFWLIIIKHSEEYKAAGFKTISQTMSEKQIRLLIFIWVFFSTLLLLLFSAMELVLNKQLTYILIPLNIVFILVFYALLFKHNGQKEIKGVSVLINSFCFLVMILFIINSFLS